MNALLTELMGPTLGSSVNAYPLRTTSHLRWLISPFSSQPGVIVPVIPDPKHPENTVYWLGNDCRVYHTELNEVTVPGHMTPSYYAH
jgi:hypothetical protein